MKLIDKVAIAISIITFTGAVVAGFFGDRTASIVMLGSLLITWQVWLTIEIITIRRKFSYLDQPLKDKSALPEPILNEINNEPVFVDSRQNSSTKEIPYIDSQFITLQSGTFCIWVNIVPSLRKLDKTPKYIFSHTSDSNDEGQPNAFCLYHSNTNPNWGFLFHGNPEKEGNKIHKTFISSPSDDGIHLISVRWRKNQGEAEVLFDDKVKYKLTSFTNWPVSGNSPVYLGGWVKGGWNSYIKSKLYNVVVYNEWFSNEQITSILKQRPEM